ncbi:MAG: hypothetical protein MI785_15435, partial [Kiloniellales bacterium]|nr:hypothetical protein [Kiloniellales bacterium]
RTFNLSAARGGRRHYGDEGEGLDTMQHSDEAAAASELAAMGHQLAALSRPRLPISRRMPARCLSTAKSHGRLTNSLVVR